MLHVACLARRKALLALATWGLALASLGVATAHPFPHTQSVSARTPRLQVFVQPGAHAGPILSLIRRARHSIRLEIYLLTNRTTIKELARARRRRVDVRVLLEQHPYGGARYARLGYHALKDAGVPVRWANEAAFTFTHEKAMEVDGKLAGIFTSNLTSSGIFRNREFGVVEANTQDARALAAIFSADWNRRDAHISDPRLVVSPYNSRADLDALIATARHSLDIYAEEVADQGIEGLLATAVVRGVRVRLITSTESQGVAEMRRRGISVSLMGHPFVHAKVIVADRSRVFMGSENLSSTSLDRNREVGILLEDPTAIARVEATFEADWRSGSGARSAPSAESQAGRLRVRLSTHPPAVRKGEALTISIETSPGATCSVRVEYPDGYVSHARALGALKTANSAGTASWRWHVGTRVTGTARVAAVCKLGPVTKSTTATFEVLR